MNRNFVKYFVDIGMFLSFLAVAITGVLKFRSFLGFFGVELDYASMNMRLMSRVHDWTGILIVVFVLIHLILNWSWIVSTTKQLFCREVE